MTASRKKFRIGPVGPKASTGEYYFTLTHAGRKEEGADVPFWFHGSEAVATASAKAAFNERLMAEIAMHPGMDIEWRMRPKFNEWFDWRKKQWRVGMRARIAFVPAMAEAA